MEGKMAMKKVRLLVLLCIVMLMSSGVAFCGAWKVSEEGAKIWDHSPQQNAKVFWSGGRDAEGFGTGLGVLQWQENGSVAERYEGELLKGKTHGKGKLFYGNKDVYEGEFRDAFPNGRGRYQWANGASYEGDFVNGKLEGQGTLRYVDGRTYRGDFLNGKRHGQGTLSAANGDVIWTGQWEYGTQKSDIGHFAKPEEIVGYWELVQWPEALKRINKVDPWPATPYQYFVFYADGKAASIMSTLERKTTRSDLDESNKVLRGAMSYEYKEGIMLIRNAQIPGYQEKWGVNIIEKKFQAAGVDHLPGDMLMSLEDGTGKVVYYRHLRRMP
ncbi:hypothetical protein [Azotosporobacter soli]|uniref:MORN repeat-containing protein n=1 Tax=Azotosporobacter soli TaxID=3055040 RepID=UPI0031FEB6C6